MPQNQTIKIFIFLMPITLFLIYCSNNQNKGSESEIEYQQSRVMAEFAFKYQADTDFIDKHYFYTFLYQENMNKLENILISNPSIDDIISLDTAYLFIVHGGSYPNKRFQLKAKREHIQYFNKLIHESKIGHLPFKCDVIIIAKLDSVYKVAYKISPYIDTHIDGDEKYSSAEIELEVGDTFVFDGEIVTLVEIPKKSH